MKSELINEKIKCSHISKHPLFDQVSKEDIHDISLHAQLVRLKTKSPFLLNDNASSKVYFLGKGTAKLVSTDSRSRDFVKDILVEGGAFGDMSLTGFITEGYISALMPNTWIFYFEAEEFRSLMLRHKQLSLNYAEIIGTKLRQLEKRHFTWINKDAKHRLLYFIRDWSDIAGSKAGNMTIMENHFSLNDIADFIGVSRQFIHIMLKELRDEGLVNYSRKKIEIVSTFLNTTAGENRKKVS